MRSFSGTRLIKRAAVVKLLNFIIHIIIHLHILPAHSEIQKQIIITKLLLERNCNGVKVNENIINNGVVEPGEQRIRNIS